MDAVAAAAAELPAAADSKQKYEHATTASSDDPDVCFICLGEWRDDESAQWIQGCGCKQQVHRACLARWRLQRAGTREERVCRLCGDAYSQVSWQHDLTPSGLVPQDPVMSVHFGGRAYLVRVSPGEEGRRSFLTVVRAMLGLSDEQEFDVMFECRLPPVVVPGGGSRVDLKGLSAYDAAVFCAALTAADRKRTRGLEHEQQEQEQEQERRQMALYESANGAGGGGAAGAGDVHSAANAAAGAGAGAGAMHADALRHSVSAPAAAPGTTAASNSSSGSQGGSSNACPPQSGTGRCTHSGGGGAPPQLPSLYTPANSAATSASNAASTAAAAAGMSGSAHSAPLPRMHDEHELIYGNAASAAHTDVSMHRRSYMQSSGGAAEMRSPDAAVEGIARDADTNSSAAAGAAPNGHALQALMLARASNCPSSGRMPASAIAAASAAVAAAAAAAAAAADDDADGGVFDLGRSRRTTGMISEPVRSASSRSIRSGGLLMQPHAGDAVGMEALQGLRNSAPPRTLRRGRGAAGAVDLPAHRISQHGNPAAAAAAAPAAPAAALPAAPRMVSTAIAAASAAAASVPHANRAAPATAAGQPRAPRSSAVTAHEVMPGRTVPAPVRVRAARPAPALAPAAPSAAAPAAAAAPHGADGSVSRAAGSVNRAAGSGTGSSRQREGTQKGNSKPLRRFILAMMCIGPST